MYYTHTHTHAHTHTHFEAGKAIRTGEWSAEKLEEVLKSQLICIIITLIRLGTDLAEIH